MDFTIDKYGRLQNAKNVVKKVIVKGRSAR